ncbi:MAG: SCP2 sterol-binding domain-containing protein [Anaerolineae bacterium]|nr:SCP2 sterol-binding domain-containing protein [Anaerolineae bacterium]
MPSKEEINAFIARMPELFLPEKAAGLNTIIQLDLSGENGGSWWIRIADGQCEIQEGQADSPQMTLKSTADDLYAVLSGEANAISSFMQGKIKVQGDMALALKMQTMFDFEAA